MKKITILLILLASITITAQTLPTAKTYKQQDSIYWKNSLQLIEPQITTGILYNKVSPFSNLYNFNTIEYNTADASLFKQALSEMHRASENQSHFISVNSLRSAKKQIHLSKNNPSIPVVEIGVLNTSFNFLFYDEKNEDNGGLKLIDTVYTPIVGKTSIFEKHISLISPQQEIVTTSNNGMISFRMNNAFYFNKDKSIKTLTTNFGSNTTFTLVNNEVVNTNTHQVTYTNFGKKVIEFNIVYTDNTTLTTYAKIQIISPQSLQRVSPLTDCTKTNVISYTSTIPYQAWDEQTAINGKLEYKIFFANNNLNGNCDLTRIKKPFIVIDGFDPGDKRRIELSDCDPICQKLNENLEEIFIPNDYKSIVSLMKYGNEDDDNIIEDLLDDNYDVIIINLPTERASWNYKTILHDYGADFIQRNAMTFSSFIKEVNTKLEENNSTEELVVVGPSMGGQITRYALAYMEKKEQETNDNSWYHNTRLWLSMDSPHQGANIPLAVQGSMYFYGFIIGSNEAIDKYNQTLRSPAAKQMLIDHYDYSPTSTSSPYFTNYQADLAVNGLENSNGYPTLSRNIAMVNGSIAGVRNANAGQRFLDMRGYIDLSWWFFDWTINVLSIKNNYQYNTNNEGTVFNASGVRDNHWSELEINWRRQIFNSLNTHWQGSLDVVPGGYFNSGNDLKEELVFKLKGKNIRRKMYTPSSESGTVIPHAFIPTHSGLDTNGFSNWYQPIDENLLCDTQNPKTPFDNYFGENHNSDHVSFTQKSKDWLFAELDADPVTGPFPAPSVYLTSDDLIGDNTICNGETKTYYFEDCKITGDITWTVHPNLDIVPQTPTNNNSITVTPNQDFSTSWIKAELDDGTIITKYINSLSRANIRIEDIGNHQLIKLKNLGFDDAIIWSVINVTNGGQLIHSNSTARASGLADGWTVQGEAVITNSCGSITLPFYAEDPCLHYLQQIATNRYIIRDCNGISVPIDNSELYNAYGIKEQDLIPVNGEIELNNSQTGTIKIIKAVDIDGNTKIKRVIID